LRSGPAQPSTPKASHAAGYRRVNEGYGNFSPAAD